MSSSSEADRIPSPDLGPGLQFAEPRATRAIELMRPGAVKPPPVAGLRPHSSPDLPPPPTGALRLFLQRTFEGGAKAVLAGVFAYALLFNFSVVRGNSMAPGIHDGDRILVNHLSLYFTDVRRGDIVVLRYPLDPTVDYIKRIVGLPGDRIRIERGLVYVNDEVLEEPYVGAPDPYTSVAVTVEPGHYYVLGDNRLHSSDSREFGSVPAAYLRGEVDLRVWPPSRIGTID